MALFWTIYWGFSSFVFGAIVGSFLNVCIWRLPRGESLVRPPSHCPSCRHTLRLWPDMAPLVSQVWYRSRCRYCGTPFSWRYFWVELLTALLFTAVYCRYAVFDAPGLDDFTETGIVLAGMLYVSALVVIVFIDLAEFKIADETIAVAAVAALAKDILLMRAGERSLWHGVPGLPASIQIPAPESVLFGLLAFWLLWQFAALATAVMNQEAMGAGDSFLLGVMGAFLLPWPLLVVAFLTAVMLGTVGGIAGNWLYYRNRARATASQGTAEPETPPGRATEPGEADVPEEGTPARAEAGAATLPFEAATDEPGHRECEEPLPVAGAVELGTPAGDGESGNVAESPALPVVGSAVEYRCEFEAEGEPGETLPHELSEPGVATAAGTEEAPGEQEQRSAAGEPPDFPPLTAGGRWGRIWTVLGSWAGLASVWLGAYFWAVQPGTGLAVGAAGLAVTAALLYFGVRMWMEGDRDWQHQMEAHFEGDPGPRAIPFGPYLVAGTLVAMFFGRELVEGYLVHVMAVTPSVLSNLRWR